MATQQQPMRCEDIEIPAKYLAVRYDVWRYDGESWHLNASRPTLEAAEEHADKLLAMDCNICTRIVKRTSEVVVDPPPPAAPVAGRGWCGRQPTRRHAMRFRITSKQFPAPMYAANTFSDDREQTAWIPPFSDRADEAYVYDERDNPTTKLRYWRAIAKGMGMDPKAFFVEVIG